jgi:hypothetical protein
VRRYDDPVEVRRGWVTGPGHTGEGPEQFVWRGRLWKVRAVLAHWVETGPWWQSSGVRAVIGSDEAGEPDGAASPLHDRPTHDRPTHDRPTHDLLGERELWRVEAGRGPDAGGVFDLSFDWDDGRWQLVGCAD